MAGLATTLAVHPVAGSGSSSSVSCEKFGETKGLPKDSGPRRPAGRKVDVEDGEVVVALLFLRSPLRLVGRAYVQA